MSETSRTAISTIADLKALEGKEVGVSPWVTVDGSTIAHGFLILSLAPGLT